MYAYFVPYGGRTVKIWREAILGMPLLRFEIPRVLRPRKQRKMRKLLHQFQVHQVLNLPPNWEDFPIPLNPTQGLWLAKAPELVLAILRRMGIPPAQATVEVCCTWPNPAATALLSKLIPNVRQVTFQQPPSELMAWEMQRSWGVSPTVARGDLAVCFQPAERPQMLPLWMERPVVEGVTFRASGVPVPEDCPEEALLAAMHTLGYLDAPEIQVCIRAAATSEPAKSGI